MHNRITLSALLAVASTGSLISAQTEDKKAQDPHGQVKEAAATKVEPGMPLKFNVTGLTKDNVDKVKLSLTSMETPIYVCDGGKHEQATAGRCSPCNVDMKAAKGPVLSEAVPSFETESIRVTPAAARTLRYSDLENVLKKNSIQIDAAKFPIAGKARLVLLGGTLDDAKLIEKALVDAKLFDSVKAELDAASNEIHVTVQANATPPMHSKVASTIAGLGTKAKLSDVLWGPPASTRA